MSDLALEDIPRNFFEASRQSVEGKLAQEPAAGWEPLKAQMWYDSIIDWMFANPGGSIKECAAALGRSPVTIGLIARSDLFKARYVQRRAAFNEALDHRLVGKLAKVAEKGLDLMLEVMEKKQDQVPLPLLNDITTKAMDRLGYGGPSRSDSPAVHVNVNNNSVEVVDQSSLALARENMRRLEQMRVLNPSRSPGPDEPTAREAGEELL